MAKIDTTIISQVLRNQGITDDSQIANMIEQMRVLAEEEQQQQEANHSNKYKKRIAVIQARPYILDTESPIENFTVFLLRVPAIMSDEEVVKAISLVAYEFNNRQTSEARKVRNIGEALTYLKPKQFKAAHIQLISKNEEFPIIPLNNNEGNFTEALNLEEFESRLYNTTEQTNNQTETN